MSRSRQAMEREPEAIDTEKNRCHEREMERGASPWNIRSLIFRVLFEQAFFILELF